MASFDPALRVVGGATEVLIARVAVSALDVRTETSHLCDNQVADARIVHRRADYDHLAP
jgi:hypothetical protein